MTPTIRERIRQSMARLGLDLSPATLNSTCAEASARGELTSLLTLSVQATERAS